VTGDVAGSVRARDIAVGTTSPTRVLGPITRTGIVRYAGAGGDFNVIHHDEPFARSQGHPSVFAMGLYPAGVLAAAVTDWLGLRGLRSFSARFHSPVWPGDVLRMSATVVRMSQQGDGVLVEVSVSGTTPAGVVKLSGTGTVVLDD
jgi:acyl dehydratase